MRSYAASPKRSRSDRGMPPIAGLSSSSFKIDDDKCPLEIPLLNCEAPRRVPACRKLIQLFQVLCRGRASATSLFVLFTKRRCLDGQKVKTPGVDSGRCAHLESRRQKEDPSDKHRPIPKTKRRGYSAKGIQPWGVPRFSGVTLGLVS
jgi:hypothetical protein